jgi:hypothetical protein
MEKKWFAMVDGKIKGPYDRPELETQMSGWQNPLIWGRGQSEWVPPTKWLQALHKTEELVKASQVHPAQMWRVKNGEQETKPMTHDQMMVFLKELTDLSQVKLWTEGYADWKEVFQIHKIMDDLGVSRRVHPRVPIMGTLACEGNGVNFNARLQSISEGGLGVITPQPIRIGEKFRATVKSPNLTSPISMTIEVVYTAASGYAGLRFSGLQTEAQSLIVEYVNKFKTLEK